MASRPYAAGLPSLATCPCRHDNVDVGTRIESDSPLVVSDLNRRFSGREVVKRLSFVLDRGARVALWGPNGSGKTTVLRCIAGTLVPTGGGVTVCGHPAGSIAARSVLGVSLSQERSFYLRLSGHANLVLFARIRGDARRAAERRVRALEEELEIQEIASERIDRCSTGMIQQLAFARALLGDPAVLALDEPTRSLDAEAIGRVWAALDRRARSAVVMATHLDADVRRCTRRVDLPA